MTPQHLPGSGKHQVPLCCAYVVYPPTPFLSSMELDLMSVATILHMEVAVAIIVIVVSVGFFMIYGLRTGWCALESVDTEIKRLDN